MLDLLNAKELPTWFSYPEDFLELVRRGVVDIGPWQLLEGSWLRVRHDGLKKRFPARSLVPFARRVDCDDVACWDESRPQKVCVVHDFAAPGWEGREEYESFQAWYTAAQEEAGDAEP
jgi:hypothetical protein